jgi:hypothetical protein
MTKDIAILNRQGMALFNFMRMKHQNDKQIGDLTIKDFVEMCEFLAELKAGNAEDKNQGKSETVENQINDANVLHTFYFEGQKIRIVMKDGRPWFVLDDVCKALQINPEEINENELAISKIDLNNAKCNLIDFNSTKTNNGEHNGK